MNRTVDRIVAYAALIADPEEIVLFGSMKRGTHDVHSDLDLLIVTHDDIANRQISRRVEHFAQELALKADILVYSKEALRLAVAQPHSFLASISQDGKVVYRRCKNSLAF